LQSIAIRFFGVLLLVAALTWVGIVLHRKALSPAEAEARLDAITTLDWDSVVDDDSVTRQISWMGGPFWSQGREDGYTERLLEAALNVELTPACTDKTAYSKLKPLLFAGGSPPDITWDGDPIHVQQDKHHGFILEIPFDVIQRYAPTYFRIVTENNGHYPYTWWYADVDGKNFGIPNMFNDGAFSRPGIWRMDWLANVGITKKPETLAEFREAFHHFTHSDPDGNGKNDTYGMSGNLTGWYTFFAEFFGAFNELPFDWMRRGDRIVYGGIEPGTKQALAVLRDWYADGIIDPDFVTDGLGGGKRLLKKFQTGRSGYLGNDGWYPKHFNPDSSNATVNIMAQLQPDAVVEAGPFPVGPDGHRGARYWGPGGNIFVFGGHLKKEPAKIIRILKIIEYMLTNGEEFYSRCMRGERGLHWEYRVPDAGTPGTGKSSGLEPLPPYGVTKDIKPELVGPFWLVPGMMIEWDDKYRHPDELAFRDTYNKPEWTLVDALGKPDRIPLAAKYMMDLRNWQLTVFAEIIRGERELDAFDDYVTTWLERGGEAMTEQANAYGQRMIELEKRVKARL
jgi:putative aldouronate transport system substrate-binding protein